MLKPEPARRVEHKQLTATVPASVYKLLRRLEADFPAIVARSRGSTLVTTLLVAGLQGLAKDVPGLRPTISAVIDLPRRKSREPA